MEVPESEIRKKIRLYLNEKEYALSDNSERIFSLLEIRKEKYGKYYCPCRMITGIKEIDDKSICPCVYHEEEILKEGKCHCDFLMKGKNNEGN